MRLHWENKTFKSKRSIERYVKNDLDGEKKANSVYFRQKPVLRF